MAPKQELLNEIHNNLEAPNQIARRYAIGKWVSVEERLPEFDENNIFIGSFRFIDGSIVTDAFVDLNEVTHWLEMDLPED